MAIPNPVAQVKKALGKARSATGVLVKTSADLILISLFTLVTLSFTYVPALNQTILKLAFGLAMLLFIPGYVLIAALYPNKKAVKGAERLVLSFGMSICLFPMIGLVLNYTPWGIRFGPLVACLTAFTFAFALVASARRLRLRGEERYFVDPRAMLARARAVVFAERSDFDTALIFTLVLSIAVSVFVIGYGVTMSWQTERYTDFYVLGPHGVADSYPTSFSYNESSKVIVGITNHEYRDVVYDLVVSLNDSTHDHLLYHQTVPVARDQRWEMPVNVTPNCNGTAMRLNFLLYLDGNETKPYRECHFKVDVTSPI